MNVYNKSNRLKVYFDAEFTGLHRNSTLISIGMVTENNSTFYAEFIDYDSSQITPWIQENVINNLMLKFAPSGYVHRITNKNSKFSNGQLEDIIIRDESSVIYRSLIYWLEHECKISNCEQIQFISDCYAYDWMLLVDLLSVDKNALSMPDFINYIPLDLSTMLYMNGIDPDISREKFCGIESLNKISSFIEKSFDNPKLDPSYIKHPLKHNSLWDALVIKECMSKLKKLERCNHE